MKVSYLSLYLICRSAQATPSEEGGPKFVDMHEDEFEDLGRGEVNDTSKGKGNTPPSEPGATFAERLGQITDPATPPPVDNAITKFLEMQGFVDGKYIKYGDSEVDFHTLSEAEKLNILNSLTKPELDGDKKIISDLLDTGISLKDIARQLLADDINYSKMSADEIQTIAIKNEYGEDLTEEEIESELERRKKSPLYNRQTEKIRKDLEASAEKTDLSTISAMSRESVQKQIDAEAAEFVQASQKIENIAGFIVDDNTRNFILKDLVEVDEEFQSELLRDLQDPQKAFEHRYAYKMLPHIVNYYQEQIAAIEARVRQELLEGMPGQPITANRIQQTPPKQETPAPAAQTPPASVKPPQQKPGEAVAARLGKTPAPVTAGNSDDDDWNQTSLDD